jgi:hypothetical protein
LEELATSGLDRTAFVPESTRNGAPRDISSRPSRASRPGRLRRERRVLGQADFAVGEEPIRLVKKRRNMGGISLRDEHPVQDAILVDGRGATATSLKR